MGLNLHTLGALPPGTMLGPLDLAAPIVPPRALRLNATTRAYDIDANGRLVDLHPTAAAVNTALLTIRGKLKHLVVVGAAWDHVDIGDPDRLESQVRDVVRGALDRLVKAERIAIDSIRAELRDGGYAARVEYRILDIAIGEKASRDAEVVL